MRSNKKRLFFETEEVTTVKKKGWIDIELDYTQFYTNISKLILKIDDKWAIKYLFWIVPYCNEQNMIPHSEAMIQKFIKWLSENGIEKPPSIKSVRDAITQLVKTEIFVKHAQNSYQLNPLFLWSDSIDKRINHLKELGKYDHFELVETETPKRLK